MSIKPEADVKLSNPAGLALSRPRYVKKGKGDRQKRPDRNPFALGLALALCVCLLLLLPQIPLAKDAKLKELAKPLDFGVEDLSFLRSRSANPEKAAPVVVGSQIHVISSRKKLVTFDLAGNRTASNDINFRPVSSPTVDGDKLYVGGDDGALHCLRLADGGQQWSKDLKTIDFSTPAIAGDKVIVQTANDRVVALKVGAGEYAWEFQHIRTDDLAVRGLCPPLVDQTMVFVGLAGGAVAGMDLAAGSQAWKTRSFHGESFKDVDAPLLADEASLYAVSVSGEIVSLSKKTGQVFWTVKGGGMAGATLEGDIIYLATDQLEMMAINKVGGKIVWQTKFSDKDKISFIDLPTTPIVAGPYVLTVTRYGRLIVLDKATGAMVASKEFFCDVSAPLEKVGETGFLFMDNRGVIRLWAAGPF